MSNDLNRCTFIGRLGKDPEMRYTASGAAIANVSLAVGSKWRDKESGQNKESTEWVRVVAFQRLAEIMGEYLKKGSQVYIEGKLQTRKWQDKDGQDRYTTEIVASQMQMLGARSGTESNTPEQAQRPSQSGFRDKPEKPVTMDDFDQDSIPF